MVCLWAMLVKNTKARYMQPDMTHTQQWQLLFSELEHPINFSFGMATSVLYASTMHSSSHWATQHEKHQPTGDIYDHAPKQRLTSLHSMQQCGMACQWEMFYIHAGKCSSMLCQWMFISKVMGCYRGVWHGVPMGDVGQHTLP